MRLSRILLLLALLAAAAAAAIVSWALTTPYAGFSNEVFVDIPKGTSSRNVARQLAGVGVVRYDWEFLLVRSLRPSSRLQAGEYLFRKPATPWEVFDRLVRGDIFYYEFTVPEGNNTFDIGAALEAEGIMPAAQFLEAARDPSLIYDLDPRAPSLEGYLFPDTYRLTRHTPAHELCRRMTARFRAEWRRLAPGGADVHDTVTLASLVEKEAKLPDERPVIASVFLNRLRLDMPLQCDPTTIYAALLEDRYRGTIYRSDLASKQLYNTYQHTGLPPGPIANPGAASLNAVLHPEQTDYLYFVARADGSGGHRFSRELAAHVRAVEQYRHATVQNHEADPPRRAPRAPATRNHR